MSNKMGFFSTNDPPRIYKRASEISRLAVGTNNGLIKISWELKYAVSAVVLVFWVFLIKIVGSSGGGT